jgi:hypothetical protein
VSSRSGAWTLAAAAERSKEHRVLVTRDRADARRLDAHSVLLGGANGADEPLLVTDDDALASCYLRQVKSPLVISNSPNGASRERAVE